MSETAVKRWDVELTIAGAVILLMLPLLGIPVKTYLTLTIAGLAMGMLLFLIASGVSIIFGLMDVLNFAHGALFAWGAYVGFSVFGRLREWVEADSVLLNFGVFIVAILVAMALASLADCSHCCVCDDGPLTFCWKQNVAAELETLSKEEETET